MKKQLTGVLALVAGLACLAGCTDNNSNKTPQYDLDAAKGALQGLVGTTGEGRVDYELPNSISVGDYTYTVSWTTNATEGVVLDAGEETTYVDVDRSLTVNLTYNLVGTITAPDGTTIEAPVKRTLLKAPTTVPGDAITAAPVAGTPYVYHVYQSTLDKDLYFTGEMNGYYFKTTENAEEAVSVYVEYVENSTELFNLYFLDSIGDKQYIGVKQNDTHNNIVFGEEVVSSFTYDATVGSIITTIDLVDGETTTPTSFYLGNYSSFYTIQASKTSYAGSEGNNVGHLVTLIDKTTVADADKVADAKKALDIETSYFGNNVVRLPDQGDRYPEVSITWTAEENANVSVSGKKLITTNPSAVQTVKLTATITCGESTDTKEFTVSVKPQLNTPAEVVDAAYALAAGEVLGEYTLTGVITSVDLAYDSNYKNVTVTIAVAGKEDKPIVAFRLKGENADVIKAGDTITVTGTLKNYNGTVEFDAGCTLDAYVAGDTPVVPDDSTSSDNGSESTGGSETPDLSTPEAIVNAAYSLGLGESLPNSVTLTGVITSVDTAYSTQYKNVTVTIVVGNMTDKPIICFRLKGTGADVIKVGDTITVSGTIVNYVYDENDTTGEIEFTSGCTLDSYEAKDPTDAEKVAFEKNKLSLKSEVEGVAEITLSTTGSVYTDVLISWTLVANENASIVDNVLNITNPSADTTVTVTATVKSGDVTETKEFVINVKAVSASEIKYYADLETLTANSSYTTSTTTNGWTATNCAVQTGGAEGTNSGSAFNAFFGTDTNAKGVCLNGKTSAVGSLTSPTLKGGVKSISFNYGFGFSEKNGVSLTVTVYSTDGSELAKTTCVNTSVTKLETYEFTWDLTSNNITVDCYIVITNNSPSNNSGNKDRTTIWNVAWVPASTEENA